jgi:hypothetical protein
MGSNRHDRRAAAKAGSILSARYLINSNVVERAKIDPFDIISYHVDKGLRELDAAGGDVLAHAVITIGRHPLPGYSGGIVVEVKTDKLKPEGAGGDDLELDLPEPDELYPKPSRS